VKTSQDEKNIKAFGKNVMRLRKKEGISQAQLGYESAIPANTIARIERGELNTAIANAYRIAEALNVEVGELFMQHK